MAKEKVEFGESDFKNCDAKLRYCNEFEKKVCIAQRLVDVKSLESVGVKCFQWIKQMGLENFLELDEPARDHYTRLFYANIEPQAKDTKLMIYVNGEERELTSELLNKILRIPNEGAVVHPHRGNLGVGCYSPKKWCMKLSGNTVDHKVPAASLNKSRKVLHYYVCQMVYPKAGTIDKVSNFEAFLLWAIENNYKLNLGHVIIEKIVSDRNKSVSRLPYGMVISKIYEYFGETCSKEAGKNVSQIMDASWVKTLSFVESIDDAEKDGNAKRKKDISPESFLTKKLKAEPSVEKKGTVKGIKIEEKQADKKDSNGASKKFKGKTKLESSLKEQEEEMMNKAVKRSRKETAGSRSSLQRSNENSAPIRSHRLGASASKDVGVKEDDFELMIDPERAEDEKDLPKNGAPEMKEQALAEEATKQLPKLEEQEEATQQQPTSEEQETSCKEKKSFTPPEGSSPKEGYNMKFDLISQADDSPEPPNESDFVKHEDIVLNEQSDEDISFSLEFDYIYRSSKFDDELKSTIFEEGESSGLITGPPTRNEVYSAILEGKVSQPAPPDDITWKSYFNATWDDPTGPDGTLKNVTVEEPVGEPPDENIEQYFAHVQANSVVAHVEPRNENMEQPFIVIEPNGEQAQPPNADLEQRMNVVRQDVAEVKEQRAADDAEVKEQMAAALSSFQTELRNLNERVEALPSLIVAQIRDMFTPPKP